MRCLSDDEDTSIPTAAVDRELSKAEQMLDDATTANEVGISKATIVNRLYYSCFHGAQAALYARGYDPESHGRVQTLLGRELVLSGEVPREFGRFFNDIETYRRRVDYGSGGVERDTEELLEQTTAFLNAMRTIASHDQTD